MYYLFAITPRESHVLFYWVPIWNDDWKHPDIVCLSGNPRSLGLQRGWKRSEDFLAPALDTLGRIPIRALMHPRLNSSHFFSKYVDNCSVLGSMPTKMGYFTIKTKWIESSLVGRLAMTLSAPKKCNSSTTVSLWNLTIQIFSLGKSQLKYELINKSLEMVYIFSNSTGIIYSHQT